MIILHLICSIILTNYRNAHIQDKGTIVSHPSTNLFDQTATTRQTISLNEILYSIAQEGMNRRQINVQSSPPLTSKATHANHNETYCLTPNDTYCYNPKSLEQVGQLETMARGKINRKRG